MTTIEAANDGVTRATVVRVLDGETRSRLRSLNAVSRRLRGLGFLVEGETPNPFDGGAPVIALRDVSARRQRVLLTLVDATTRHAARNLRTACLSGVRLQWPDCVPANV